MNLKAFLSLLLLATLLAACATEPKFSNVTRKMVGAEGGSVETSDKKVNLVIPTGALATELTITPLTSLSDPDVVPGTAYDFGPDGTEFFEPVTLTLSYDPSVLAADKDEVLMQIVKLHDDGTVELSESQVDKTNQTLAAEIKSFSNRAVHCCHFPSFRPATLTATYNQDRSITTTWVAEHMQYSFRLERAVRNCTPGQANNPCDLANPDPLDSDYSVRAEFDPGIDSFVDHNIGSGPAFHYYRVRAFSGQTLGPPSNVVRVTVFGAQTPPPTPSNFSANAASGSIVSLSWDFTPETESNEAYQLVTGLSSTDIFYTDKGLSPETDYQYRLKAVNSAGESGYAFASATTKAGCTDFTLDLNPTVITAPAGSSDALPIAISRAAGFNDDILLSLEGDTQVFEVFSFDPATLRLGDTQSHFAYDLKEAPLATEQANLTLRGESANNSSVQCAFSFVMNITSSSDTVVPVVGISHPLEGSIVTGPSVDLTGLASDNPAVTQITYQLNGNAEEVIFTGNQAAERFKRYGQRSA